MHLERKIVERIRELTLNDMKHKTRTELLASPAEELGELARELKIEFKTYGNGYKVADEGSKAEAVDLFIGAACLYFVDIEAENIPNSDFTYTLSHHAVGMFTSHIKCVKLKEFSGDIWKLFQKLCIMLGNCSTPYNSRDCLDFSQYALFVFTELGGTYEEFLATITEKLDKWEEKTKLDDIKVEA